MEAANQQDNNDDKKEQDRSSPQNPLSSGELYSLKSRNRINTNNNSGNTTTSNHSHATHNNTPSEAPNAITTPPVPTIASNKWSAKSLDGQQLENDDIFDSLLTLEEQFTEHGKREGQKAGSQAGRVYCTILSSTDYYRVE